MLKLNDKSNRYPKLSFITDKNRKTCINNEDNEDQFSVDSNESSFSITRSVKWKTQTGL